MAYNGKLLGDKFLRKYGFRDSASRARVFEWINDIVRDICVSYAWSFLRVRVKKQIPANTQELDIAPSVPGAPVVIEEGVGQFQINDKIRIKVTFLLLDDTKEIINSIESKGSVASNTLMVVEANKAIKISNIATYVGEAIRPNIIYRRIYVSVGDTDFVLHKTIEDNTTLETIIVKQSLSVETPPDTGMAQKLVSDPFLHNMRRPLIEATLEQLTAYDADLERVGTPQYYVKLSPSKILLYPTTSEVTTLSYFVQKVPKLVIDDSETPLQIPETLKEVIEAGVTSKYYEDKDQNGQESKLANYEAKKMDAAGKHASDGAKFGTVRDVW